MITPAKYFGGKTRLSPQIVALLPPHRVYVEPFAGSAAVLFRKRQSAHEIINDRDGSLVAFFRCMRDRPDELHRVCDLERARRWWVRTQQGFGRIPTRSGWSTSIDQRSNNARAIVNRVATFDDAAARLRGVSIENMDAIELVQKYDAPDGVMYVDPPYLDETRTAYADSRRPGGDYVHEFADRSLHHHLLNKLDACDAFVVISGYPSSLYTKRLAHWRRIDIDVTKASGHGRGEGPQRATECLWVNRPIEMQHALF
jgi:DNA adenine methylase